MTETMEEDVLGEAARWRSDGRRVALVTVIRTWPSSPRRVGSQLAVRDDGHFLGSVSGGCAEGMVLEEARKTIDDGVARTFEFGVPDELARQYGLACGGRAAVYIEAIE